MYCALEYLSDKLVCFLIWGFRFGFYMLVVWKRLCFFLVNILDRTWFPPPLLRWRRVYRHHRPGDIIWSLRRERPSHGDVFPPNQHKDSAVSHHVWSTINVNFITKERNQTTEVQISSFLFRIYNTTTASRKCCMKWNRHTVKSTWHWHPWWSFTVRR